MQNIQSVDKFLTLLYYQVNNLTMTRKTKCITVTEEQDQKIRGIQARRIMSEGKSVSYSAVLQQAIDEGLEKIA